MKIKWLIFLGGCAFALSGWAQEASCMKEMEGRYSLVRVSRSENYQKVVRELVDPQVGFDKPFAEWRVQSGELTHLGLVTGNRLTLTVEEAGGLGLAEVFKNFGAKPLCAGAFSQDVQIVKVDMSGMSSAQFNGFMVYASRFWPGNEFEEADLKKVDYFFVQNRSMTGVIDIFIFIPLARAPLPS